MSAALFYLSNFYIGLFVWNPCGETLPQGFLHIRTGGLYTRRVRGYSRRRTIARSWLASPVPRSNPSEKSSGNRLSSNPRRA